MAVILLNVFPSMPSLPVNSRYIAHLPILASSTLAALAVWYFHAYQISTPLFLGIIAGGLVDLDNRLTGRLRNVFFTLLHFSAAALLVQLTMGHSVWFTVLMTLAAFTVTLAGALDIRYRTIAFGSLLVMMYTLLTWQPHIPWYLNPLMIVCGTLVYSMCTIALHILLPHRPVQQNLATAWRTLADYMTLKAQFFDPDEADFLAGKEMALALKNSTVINAFNQCRRALFYRLRSQHRHPRTVRLLQYYLAAQDIHERISSRYVEYRDFARQLTHSDLIYRIQRLIVLQAHICSDMAKSLRDNTDFIGDGALKRAGRGLNNALAQHLQHHSAMVDSHALRQLVANVLAISDQLHRLENLKLSTDENSSSPIAGQDMERPGEMLRALLGHLTFESSVFRHAVRMALIAAFCCALVEGLALHFGYWILLSALIVCQPNYSATTTRLKQRVLGTVLGVVVGSLLPYFMPSSAGQLLIIAVSSTLFFAFRTARYSFSTFFITIQVLTGFTLMGADTHAAMYSRIIDTVVGSLIAWAAVSYLWPDWHYLALGKTGARALHGDGGYLQQILQQLRSGYADDVAYRIARRVAHERAVTLGNTVSDMSIEPKKYRAELTDGFTLLQLNYALISNISALGALRSRMKANGGRADDTVFADAFFSVGAHMAELMQHVDTRQPAAFQASLAEIQRTLAALQPHDADDEHGQYILWTQLQRIAERLPVYFNTLRHSLNQTPAAGV